MAEVPSTFALKPGESAPDFSLPDPDGTIHSLRDLIRGQKGLLIAFVCNHCPFVVHLAAELGRFADSAAEQGIATVAINANDVSRYPADSPALMKDFSTRNGWHFPYLYDEDQSIAKVYAAACTPDFYLFDAALHLTYAGQFDSTRPGRGGAPTGEDLKTAVAHLLAATPMPTPWYPSTGCSIKWKPGSEPSYFG